MKTTRAAAGLMVSLFFGASVALAGPVQFLQDHGKGNSGHHRGGSNTPVLDGLRKAARNGHGGSNTPVLDAVRHAAKNSDHPVLDALRHDYKHNHDHGYGGGYGGGYGYGDYYDRHHGYDSDARAYRDVGIANAVVDLVGIAVSASRPPVYCEPAPVRVVEVAPSGYYRTERVLVSPGHYEEYRSWVPEGRDSCGRLTGGYYLTHRNWVPDVYEDRRVWVQE